MKQTTRIILRNEALRMRAIERLEILSLEPVLWEMRISEHKSKRSLQQNARLHKLLGMMADFTGDDIESMKLEMKAKFLEPLAQLNLPNGQTWVQFKSTAKMNFRELNAFMEKVEAFAAITLQVSLPPEGYYGR